jgi:phosphopantothenoylcysteine decarboxylase / phosphopantothenate---cysteine ligase
LVTAGPTQEPIDPVRYISNHSSGRMGYALAEVAKAMGAQVHLVSGPCALPCPLGVERTMVHTAQEMLAVVQHSVAGVDVFVSAAAVVDYAPSAVAPQKIKKHQQTLSIDCIKTPDCLAHVAQLDHGPLTVGFAAETDNLLQHAKQKMAKKHCDMIIANLVGPGKGMCQSANEVTLINANGDTTPFPLQDKLELAYALWPHMAKSLAVAV